MCLALSSSYKDKTTEQWVERKYYELQDLPNLIAVLQLALVYMASLEEAGKETRTKRADEARQLELATKANVLDKNIDDIPPW